MMCLKLLISFSWPFHSCTLTESAKGEQRACNEVDGGGRAQRITKSQEEGQGERSECEQSSEDRLNTWLLFEHSWCLGLTLSQGSSNILTDDRFKMMFENPDYQVDEQSEEFRLLNPIVSKVGQRRRERLQQIAEQQVQCLSDNWTNWENK